MNIIWPIIIIISYIYAIFAGTINEVNTSIFDVSKNVLNLSLTLVGNMCLWCGIIKIIESTKIINKLTKMLKPILNFLYPDEIKNKEVMDEISINMVSNVIEQIGQPKGEYIILIEGNKEEKQNDLNFLTLEEHYKYYENKGFDKKEIIKKIAKDRKVNKNEIYQYFIKKD